MLVHVTRSAFPPSLDDYWLQVDTYGVTNFEMLLDGCEFAGWSLPASTLSGHPVWFQLTKGSLAAGQRMLREAEASGDADAAKNLRALLPELEKWSGSIIAVGLIHGGPHRADPVDGHFRGRIFAPVHQVTPMTNPVDTTSGSALSRLAPFAHTAAQLTNRVAGGDDEYRHMLEVIEAAGNTIPDWARVKLNSVAGTWYDAANERACGWIFESQLAAQFAVPLCRELSDRNRVDLEVQIKPDVEKKAVRWAVDALIEIDGTPLPVEFKLNRDAEADLPSQLRRYSGPSTLTKKTAKRQRTWRVEHPFVLLVDNQGTALFRSGEPHDLDGSVIERGAFTPESVEDLRSTLARVIAG